MLIKGHRVGGAKARGHIVGFGGVPVAPVVKRHFTELTAALGQYYTIPTVTLSGDFEIEVLFANSTLGSYQDIFCSELKLKLRVAPDGRLDIAIGKVGGWASLGVLRSAAVVADGKLHHAILTRSGNTYTLNTDGAISSVVVADTIPEILTIGRRSNSANDNFNGIISDVKIWTGGDRDTGTLIRDYEFREKWANGSKVVKNSATELGSELVANGTFGSDTSGWTPVRNAALSVVNQKLNVQNSISGYAGASQPVTLEAGKTYKLYGEYTHIDGSGFITISSDLAGTLNRQIPVKVLNVSGNFEYIFTATISEAYVSMHLGSTGAGSPDATSQFDNISIKQADGYGTAVNITDEHAELFAQVDTGWLGEFNEWKDPADFIDTQWTHDSGVYSLVGDGSYNSIRGNNTSIIGSRYRVRFDVSNLIGDGSLKFQNVSTQILTPSTDGSYTADYVADGTNSTFARTSPGDVISTDVSNISIKRLLEVA